MAKRSRRGFFSLAQLVQVPPDREYWRVSWEQGGELNEAECESLDQALTKAGELLNVGGHFVTVDHVWQLEGGAGEIAESVNLLHPSI